ncbi:conserved hypothetical protein [Tenacibaculum litopenaei]|uniref:PorP/SprF family type IX secretion system membrane protein n=1 Tax=Tenacibaculum litopenaei TaxID=396016 RepID=UPI003892FFC0
MKQTRILLIVVIFHYFFKGWSQQDPQFTQYMLNAFSFNPAYARAKEYAEITFSARSQWIGIPGAPRSQLLSVRAPWSNSNWGIGINFMNDTAGPVKELSFNVGAAYEVELSGKETLAFGMRFGGSYVRLDHNLGYIKDTGDRNLQDYIRGIRPTIGAGILYRNEKFYLGIAVPNVVRTSRVKKTTKANEATNRIHFFVDSGMWVYINQNVMFKPAMMAKAVFGAPITLDVSANFLFNNKFRVGLNYRLGNALGGLVGLKIGNASLLSYSYDLTTGAYRQYNAGTHEVVLKVGLGATGNRNSKIISF